ncbi:hypothetical protein K1T71_001229 [Dendrolimus kikuchii]|uniref:Uncharacterized protein n=1 Tax=Dendrolimus kikuchii TaxID=765133 RepID=A0ACC1DHX9_9NEOP|nr:hypothetical protein K1T71_001229 [Dendrolimus kikuchii]
MWFTTCFLAILMLIIYVCIKKSYTYWSSRGINGPTPIPFFGSVKDVIFRKNSLDGYLKRIYHEYPNDKVVGLYKGFIPLLLIRDPKIIKQVFIKDFNSFHNRGFGTSSVRFSKNLFSAQDVTWKILRQKLTPTFTSKKLKDMLPLIQQCVNNNLEYIEKLINSNQEHEVRGLAGKYTLDTIGSCAFGLDLNIYKDGRNEFSEIAAKIFNPPFLRRIWMTLDLIIPNIKIKINIKSLDGNSNVVNFFVNLVKGIIDQRGGKPSNRKDFMDLMIELKEQGLVNRQDGNSPEEIEMDDDTIAAQAIVFYAAGYEGSSATISFLLHELALNQDIQNRVYTEIYKVKELTYESLSEMTYLHMVLNETLRKTSPAGFLIRKATSNCFVSGINLTIEKGTNVIVSVSGLHSDPKYYQNPTEFNPENMKITPQCAFLPFGAGPRNCIGLRFAEIQMMMCIAGFLMKFKVSPSLRTKQHHEFDPTAISLTNLHGIWLQISKR